MPKRPRSTFVERISIAGITAHTGPLGLILYARWYLFAARQVTAPPETRLETVRTYLSCHAVELALKAFLSLKGQSLVDLSGGAYGHNLAAILAEAEAQGLAEMATLTADHKLEISRASEYYAEKLFEYPAVGEALTGFPGWPNNESLIAAADALVGALYDPCLHAQSGPVNPT
jgi:hypothetical protein